MQTTLVGSFPHDTDLTAFRKMLQSHPMFADPTVVSFAAAEETCRENESDLVFVFLPDGRDGGRDIISRLRGVVTGRLVAVGVAEDPKGILRTLQAGADLFLDREDLESELDATLMRLTSKRFTAPKVGRLLSVLSAGGGGGASTIAVNLAVVLAARHKRCALVDLNSGRGDLHALLDLKPQFSLADLCLNQERVDDTMLEKVLMPHSSGVHLLGAAPDFGNMNATSVRGVRQALALARRSFPDTVVDLEDWFHEEQLDVLQESNGIILVCRLDFTSIRHTRRCLSQLLEHNIPWSRVKVVVNQYGQPKELPVDQAEEALGVKMSLLIPRDPKAVNPANNTGIPVVIKSPRAKVSQAIARIADMDFGPKNEPVAPEDEKRAPVERAVVAAAR